MVMMVKMMKMREMADWLEKTGIGIDGIDLNKTHFVIIVINRRHRHHVIVCLCLNV